MTRGLLCTLLLLSGTACTLKNVQSVTFESAVTTRIDGAAVPSGEPARFWNDDIVIDWTVTERVRFELTARHEEGVSVLWRDAEIRIDGQSEPVVPSCVSRGRLIDQEIVPERYEVRSGESIRCFVSPRSLAEFEVHAAIGPRWRIAPLFGSIEPAEQDVGRTFEVIIPLEVDGVTRTYSFDVTLTRANVIRRRMICTIGCHYL